MFTDTHCHIYQEYYSNISELIKNAQTVGINRFINNGCDYKSNVEVLELISKYPNMYGAIGIHPESATNYTNKDLKHLENNLTNPKIIAIGEIGLDYHYTKEEKEAQLQLFEKQLILAEKYHLPVIIHSRDATEDTINMLKKHNVTGVIHSFSGSYETAQIYLKMGFYIGINGVITFKNSHLAETICKLPLNRLILETDSPYLTPDPYRGTKNNPSHILEIAQFTAKLFNISLEKLSKITNENISQLFDI